MIVIQSPSNPSLSLSLCLKNCFFLNSSYTSLFYRIMNDDLISDSNIHRMTQTNRKFSIHSKGGETVYHDIADIPVCHRIIFSVNECILFIKCLKFGVFLNLNKFPFLYFLLKLICVSLLSKRMKFIN